VRGSRQSGSRVKLFSRPANNLSDFQAELFPLRKTYVRPLMHGAGFERVRTYGDVQENEPDFTALRFDLARDDG